MPNFHEPNLRPIAAAFPSPSFRPRVARDRIRSPADAAEDSGDVLPALLGRGAAHPSPEARIFDSGNGEFAVRRGHWKAVAGDLEKLEAIASGGPAGQLYDLEADPGETQDLWAAHPEVGRALIDLLVRYRAEGRSRPHTRG